MTVYFFQIGDYLKLLWDDPKSARLAAFFNQYYRPLAAAAVVLLALPLLGRLRWRQSLFAVTFFMILPIQTALNLNQTADYVTAESWNNYGESGHRQVVEFLSTGMKPDSWISVRKDILYYLEEHRNAKIEKGVELRKIMITQNPQVLEQLFTQGKLDYIVIDPISLMGMRMEHIAVANQVFSQHYFLAAQFGNFKIFQRRRPR